MDFKQAINAFKENGDRTIIDNIIKAIDNDFMKNPTRTRVYDGSASGGIRINLSEHHEYVAYHIRAIQELLMRHVRIEYGDKREANEFQRLLSIIKIDFRIDFNATIYDSDPDIYYFNFTPELFADLEKKMEEIESWFSEDELRYFMRLFNKFKGLEETQREEVEKRRKEITETTVRALEYALKYVDTSKSEKEIVKYINMTFRSKLADDELKRNGMRRIQRKSENGERNSFVVKSYFPENSKFVIMGRDFDDSILTPGQREFIADVLAVVKVDKENGDTSNYTCDTDGEVRISKKYIAEKLGIREDLVRKKLERIKKKLSWLSQNTSIYK